MMVRLWGNICGKDETPQGKLSGLRERSQDETPEEHTRIHQRQRIQGRTQINRQSAGNQHSVAPWKPSKGEGWGEMPVCIGQL